MKKLCKKLFSILLTMCLILGALPMAAGAADNSVTDLQVIYVNGSEAVFSQNGTFNADITDLNNTTVKVTGLYTDETAELINDNGDPISVKDADGDIPLDLENGFVAENGVYTITLTLTSKDKTQSKEYTVVLTKISAKTTTELATVKADPAAGKVLTVVISNRTVNVTVPLGYNDDGSLIFTTKDNATIDASDPKITDNGNRTYTLANFSDGDTLTVVSQSGGNTCLYTVRVTYEPVLSFLGVGNVSAKIDNAISSPKISATLPSSVLADSGTGCPAQNIQVAFEAFPSTTVEYGAFDGAVFTPVTSISSGAQIDLLNNGKAPVKDNYGNFTFPADTAIRVTCTGVSLIYRLELEVEKSYENTVSYVMVGNRPCTIRDTDITGVLEGGLKDTDVVTVTVTAPCWATLTKEDGTAFTPSWEDHNGSDTYTASYTVAELKSGVVITSTAQAGNQKQYELTMRDPDTSKEILYAEIGGKIAVINGASIAAEVPCSSDLTALDITLRASPLATVLSDKIHFDKGSTTGNQFTVWNAAGADLSQPAAVTVRAEDDSTKTYTLSAAFLRAGVSVRPRAKELVYTGQAQGLVSAGTAVNGNMVYSLDGISYQADVPTAVNAGTYTVYYKAAGDGTTYADSEPESLPVTIAPKPAEALASPAPSPITYGQTLSEAGLAGGWHWENGEVVPTVVNEGYPAFYEVEDFTNIDWSGVEGYQADSHRVTRTIPLTVKKASPAVTAPTAKSGLIFNGTAQELLLAGSADGGTMQYSTDGETFTDAIPTATDAGTYTVYYRVTGDENHLDAEPQPLTAVLSPKALEKPGVSIDYSSEALEGFLPDGSYTVNGEAVQPEEGALSIQEYLGKSISIVQKAPGGNYVDSEPQVLEIPQRPAAPDGVTAQNESMPGAADGKLLGMTPEMEYSADGANWTVCGDSEVSGLSAGGYLIRFKATGSSFASAAAAVSIQPYAVPVTGVTLMLTMYHNYNPTLQLSAVVSPENATSTEVGWASSNSAVATVSSTGLVTALAEGKTEVTAMTKDGGLIVRCIIQVKTHDDGGNTPAPTKPGRPSGGGSSTVDPAPDPAPEPEPVPEGPVVESQTSADGTVTVTTTWADGKGSVSVTTPQGDKTITVTTPSGEKMAEISLPAEPGPAKEFQDVQGSAWYKESVDTVTGLGLFSGTSEESFSPNKTLTRGMLVTVLHRLSGQVEYGVDQNVFPDVSENAWYADAVNWASSAGVTSGKGNGFDPNGDITREQLVTMLYRYADAIGADTGHGQNLNSFPDSGKVSNYAKDAMEWAIAKGFVSGRAQSGKNYIAPQGTATRAEAAAVLSRFISYLQK